MLTNSKIDQLYVEALSNKLKVILTEELAKGNQVTETNKGWPHEGAIFVLLKDLFKKDYQITGLAYTEVNDRHYWKAEYVDSVNNQILSLWILNSFQ